MHIVEHSGIDLVAIQELSPTLTNPKAATTAATLTTQLLPNGQGYLGMVFLVRNTVLPMINALLMRPPPHCV